MRRGSWVFRTPGTGVHQCGTLAAFIRGTFYPSVLTASDLSFVTEQGILTAGEVVPRNELLFRLIDNKSAFEWQQGVLESFDAGERRMRLLVGGQLKAFSLAADALVYHRVGDSRLPLRKGAWVGGELVDFRAEGDVIPMLIYRINFANPAADRYSRLALWQVHKTKAELDAAFRSLKIGEFSDMRVIQRGLSERLVSTEIIGTTGRATVRALRLRTLLSVRDSLFLYDVERNAAGTVVGATFFGRGWGHGVGMCQVGAYGMALAGATYEEILKKYLQRHCAAETVLSLVQPISLGSKIVGSDYSHAFRSVVLCVLHRACFRLVGGCLSCIRLRC